MTTHAHADGHEPFREPASGSAPRDRQSLAARPTAPNTRPRSAMSPANLMLLQRSAGNKAVAGLVSGQGSPAATPSAADKGSATDAPPQDDAVRSAGSARRRQQCRRWRQGSRRALAHREGPPVARLPTRRGRCRQGRHHRRTGPQDAEHVVSAVASVIPGGDERLAQLKQTGVIEKAATWLQTQLPKAGLTWRLRQPHPQRLLGLAARLRRAESRQVGIGMVGHPGRVHQAGDGVRHLGAAQAARAHLRGRAGHGGQCRRQVMAIVKKAGNVLDKILADPIGLRAI